jgi:hypothetical protein
MKVKEECPFCEREAEIEAGDWRALRDLLTKGCAECRAHAVTGGSDDVPKV